MLTKQRQLLASLVWLSDVGVATLALATAYGLRFWVLGGVPSARAGDTVSIWGLALLSLTVVFQMSDLYSGRRLESPSNHAVRVGRAVFLSILVMVGLTYFSGAERYSRLTIGLYGITVWILLAATRRTVEAFLSRVWLHRSGRRAIVVGQGRAAEALIDRIQRAPDAGIQLVGVVPLASDAVVPLIDGSPATVAGTIDGLESIVQTQSIEQVFIALPLSEQPRLGALVDTLSATAADVLVVPDLLQFMSLHGGSHDFDGVPVVALRHGPVHGWDAVSKRAFDLVFGGLILLLVSPIMLTVAAAVKLTSRGPVFYRQERMGLDGRTFHILKFRSMRIDAEQSGARWATSGDNRTTSIGAFLRKYSLDELPQFLNVLAGDMSLVGPRPERPVFIDKFKREIPRYQLRHKVKAGITGLAQVEGWRGNTSLERRIERDIYYIENWSLWLDFKILVRTALGGFLSKNAY